jgi:hypothetical protein
MRRRARHRLCWLLMLSLALAQLAVAAHACALSAHPGLGADHCGEAAPAQPHAFDALCAGHCSPSEAAQHVPAPAILAAPYPAPIPAIVTVAADPHVGCRLDVPTGADPPPALLSCTLLI